MNTDLIMRLSYKSRAETRASIRQLIDAYVLQEIGPNQFKIQSYIREALLFQANKKTLLTAYKNAGRYYEKLARELADSADAFEALLQSLYHYKNAENWKDVLKHAEPLYQALMERGERQRSCSVAEMAIAAAKAEKNNYLAAKWITRLVKRNLELRKLDNIEKWIKEGFELLRAGSPQKKTDDISRWISQEAQLWAQRGHLAFLNKEKTKMDEFFKKGLELAEESGDRVIHAVLLVKLGRLKRYQREYELATQYLTQGKDMILGLENRRILSNCLSELGLVARALNDLDQAEKYFKDAYEISVKTGNLRGEAISYGLLGDIALRQQNYVQAERIFRERLANARAISKNSLGVRIALGWLAEALIGKGDLDEAESLLNELEVLIKDKRDDIGYAWWLRRKGLLLHAKGNISEGNQSIQKGIEMLKKSGVLYYLRDFESAIKKFPDSSSSR